MQGYIDESGDTGYTKKSTKNFVLTGVVAEENILNSIARKVFKRKISKSDKKKINMLHAHRNTETVHKAILKEILKHVDIKIYYTKDKDYIESLSKIVTEFKKLNIKEVALAKRDSRKSTIEKIDKIGFKNNTKILKTTPESEKGLQIADFISWVIFRYVEFGDDLYYKFLADRIIEVK